MTAAPRCYDCGQLIPLEDWNRPPQPCSKCARPVEAWVFPAAWTNPVGLPPTPISDENAASCFHHPANQADLACSRCGRFVCHLCCSGTSEHAVCNTCFARLTADRDPGFARRATLHDGIGLSLATLPALSIFLPIFTGPIAAVYTLATWSRTRTAVPRGPAIRWLALLCSVLGLGTFVAFVAFAVYRTRGTP